MAYSEKFDKDYYKKYNRSYYLVNKDKIRKNSKIYNKNNSEKIRNYWLKKKYGITLDIYNQLLVNQNGNCAICKINQSEFETALNVDHCHKTNKIRGLLCGNCNTALGLFNDDNVLLQIAIEYNKG